MASFINDYRIKLHNAEDDKNVLAVMASCIISYWSTSENGTLIYLKGLDAPIMVSESFDFIDGIMLKAIGVKKKPSNPISGGIKVKTLKPATSLDVATVLYKEEDAPAAEPYEE